MKKIKQLSVFSAFASRNYSLYFFGRAVSQFGTWMQRTAVIWAVYSITHSAFLIGVTIFAEQFPSFLFSIPGGVAADRYNRYTVIKITQVTSMVQAVLLAILVITGHTAIWAILLLSVLLGIINAFDVPARQSLLHDVVASPDHLPNAVSLTTATASLAQLLGPALSGIVLSAFGAGVCFLLNAASFGGVILSLLLMKLPVYKPKNSGKKVMAEFAEGFSYIKNNPDIGLVVAIVALISLLVLPYNTVIPVFAKVVFKGGASTFGYINSFVGVGAVTGTIFIASRKPGSPLKRIYFFSALLLGFGLILFFTDKILSRRHAFCCYYRFWGNSAVYCEQYSGTVWFSPRNARAGHRYPAYGHFRYGPARQRNYRGGFRTYRSANNRTGAGYHSRNNSIGI